MSRLRKGLMAITVPIISAGSAMATYSADYTSADFDDIIFDFLGNYGVEAIAFVGAIVSITVVAWLLRKLVQAKNTAGKLA